MTIYDRLSANLNAIAPYKPGTPIEDVARTFGLDPETIIKLASNENPLGPSPKAAAAMAAHIRHCHRYPDGPAFELRRKLASHYQVDLEQVMVGNGSNEILEFVGHCFLNPNTSVVFSAHSFAVYKLVAQMFGARYVEVPMTPDLVHDIQAMVARVKDDTAVIFICNPNNPTGTMVRNEELAAAVATIPESTLIVIDEAYAELTLAEMPNTLGWLRERENVLICRTFSKAYGMAGLRLGYGIGSAKLIQALQKVRQPFNVNLLAQVGGIAALDDGEFVQRSRELCRRERDYVEGVCRELGLPFIPTTTNFMLIRVGNGAEITQALMQRGVIVRAMDSYQLPEYIRLTFGTHEENVRFVNELRQLLSR